MPPGEGEGSKHARTGQHHPPASGRRDEGAPPPSRPTPPFPAVASQKRRKRRKQRQPAAASVPEGPLAEILSRLPYRSLCRFRCVSKAWLALCSDPDIVKRAPQTLSGFFHNHLVGSLCFNNLSGGGTPLVDPSLPFLRESYESFKLEQCSSSLLLCKCWESKDHEEDDQCDYVVCNPMTGQWTVLPPIVCQDEEDDDPVYYALVEPFLGFDPAVPSRFVVFAPLVELVDHVAIYSSETGRWTWSSGWEYREYPAVTAECVFLNGMLHFMHLLIDEPVIAAVDVEGEVCGEIALPEGMEGARYGYSSVGYSQGLLHAWYMDPYHYQLSVSVLEDYGSRVWTLKHTVDVPELFETESDEEDCDEEDGTCKYEMFAIHPERNLIFLTDWKGVNLSYDMDSGEVHLMCTSGDFLGGLPYIPCFADLAVG